MIPLLIFGEGCEGSAHLLWLLFAKRFDMRFQETYVIHALYWDNGGALIVADMDVISSKLLIMQLFRLLTVSVVFPQLFNALLSIRDLM